MSQPFLSPKLDTEIKLTNAYLREKRNQTRRRCENACYQQTSFIFKVGFERGCGQNILLIVPNVCLRRNQLPLEISLIKPLKRECCIQFLYLKPVITFVLRGKLLLFQEVRVQPLHKNITTN